MQKTRMIGALILLAIACVAAYYSYSVAFAPPPMHSAANGPPPGASTPKMGGPPRAASSKDGKKTIGSKESRPESNK
jgi:hypothetical protein